MQAVRLIEPGVRSDALQEKRIQWHPERFRQIGIDRVETRRIIAPIIRRRKHPAQQNCDLARFQPRQNIGQRGTGDLGVDASQASWGTLLSDGAQVINPIKSYWWLLVFPVIAMSLTLLALNFLGDGLRDALDPRQRK